MSIYGMLRTAVSGMAAQANKLSAVGDNVANASTTGYKKAMTEFSTQTLPSKPSNYNSGGVSTATRYAISQQGGLSFTTSDYDMAISGNGFFVVSKGVATGAPPVRSFDSAAGAELVLTRAGSFQVTAEGYLINAAGYYLLGASDAATNVNNLSNFNDNPIQLTDDQMSAESVSVEDGKISFVHSDATISSIQLWLANVKSPDSLEPDTGTTYKLNPKAGAININNPTSAGFGEVVGSALEQSTVDLAGELASMIEAQRGYSSNTKTFQTADEVLQEVLNLKR